MPWRCRLVGKLAQASGGTCGLWRDTAVAFIDQSFEVIPPLLKDVSFPVGNPFCKFSDQNLCLSVS